MIKLVCTFFGVGLLRPAPGTWGSVAAVALAVVVAVIDQQLDALLLGHAHGEVGPDGREVIEAEGIEFFVVEERHQKAADVGGLVHGDRRRSS